MEDHYSYIYVGSPSTHGAESEIQPSGMVESVTTLGRRLYTLTTVKPQFLFLLLLNPLKQWVAFFLYLCQKLKVCPSFPTPSLLANLVLPMLVIGL